VSETVVSGSPAPARRLRITTLARIAGLVALGLFFASQRELVQRTFASIGALSLVWYAIGLGLYVGGLLFSALRSASSSAPWSGTFPTPGWSPIV